MTDSKSEDVLQAMAEVMERQARVARAEAARAAARRRLGEATARLSSIARARGETVHLPPLDVPGLQLDPEPPPIAIEEERAGTLRQQIVAVMEASPSAHFHARETGPPWSDPSTAIRCGTRSWPWPSKGGSRSSASGSTGRRSQASRAGWWAVRHSFPVERLLVELIDPQLSEEQVRSDFESRAGLPEAHEEWTWRAQW